MLESPESNAEPRETSPFDPALAHAYEGLFAVLEGRRDGDERVERSIFADNHRRFVAQLEPRLPLGVHEKIIDSIDIDLAGIDKREANMQHAQDLLRRYHVMELFFDTHSAAELPAVVRHMLKNPG